MFTKFKTRFLIALSAIIAAMLVLVCAFMLAPQKSAHADTANFKVTDAADNTTYYGTIEEAFTAANTAGTATVTMYADAEISSTLVVENYKNITLYLNGCMLKMTGIGSVIIVGGTFTLEDNGGSTPHTILNPVTNEEVTIYGGLITGGNRLAGGGVCVNCGTFKMYGGTIAGNTAGESGGGVHVDYGGKFEMHGGTIAGNAADVSGGGVSVNGTIEMMGGTIAGNTAGGGGGVFVISGTFTMSDGTISENTATNGGGVLVNNGSFTMSDGTISENTATNGGGVLVASTFEMSGGTISKNNGDGVFPVGGTFEMSGGTISENTGWGVCLGYSGTFIMNDGTISENDGGVYVRSHSTFEVSGAVTITGNKSGDTEHNVGFDNNSITVTGALTDPDDPTKKAQIGVNDTGAVATGFTSENNPDNEKPSVYFIPDNSANNCIYISDEESGTVTIATHAMEWAYDDTNHWHECINCGEKQDDEAAHSFATGGNCTCGYTAALYWGVNGGVLTLSSYKTDAVPNTYPDLIKWGKDITSVTVDRYAYAPQSLDNMFFGCTLLTTVDLTGFDTSGVENMSYMFGVCSSLTSLDLSMLDTQNVTVMGAMFDGCSNLTTLDLSSFDTTQLSNAFAMFLGCNSLETIYTPATVGTEALPLPTRFMYNDAGEDGKHKLITLISSADGNGITITRHEECSGTDDGDCTTAVICTCGYVITAAETEHYYGAAYGFDENQHWHVCLRPGCTQTDTKANHIATDDNDCTTRLFCAICGYPVKAAETEHNYSTTWTTDENQHWHVCQNTGCTQTDTKADHEYTLNIATEAYLKSPATCTAKAVYYKSCVCGQHGTESFENGELAAHTPVSDDNAKAPTCTQSGLTASTHCSVCNTVLTEQTALDALGHTPESDDNAKAPTCTQSGLTASTHCSVCNAVLTEQTALDALGHDKVLHDAKAATCTEKGWSAYETCSRCDYTTYAETDALGHSLTHNPETPATEEEEGNTEFWACDNCDKYFADENGTSEITEKDSVITPKLTGAQPSSGNKNAIWIILIVILSIIILIEIAVIVYRAKFMNKEKGNE